MTHVKARWIARGLRANAEAIHTDAVTWEDFQKRNRALWQEAEVADVCREVTVLLRKRGETKMTKKKTASKKARTVKKKEKKPQEDKVVFAFRLLPEERALIHQAAGPAKASRFIRTLAVAASRGDEKTVLEIIQAVKAELVS